MLDFTIPLKFSPHRAKLFLCCIWSCFSWGFAQSEALPFLTLDLQSTLTLAIEKNQLSELRSESSQRFLLEVATSYLELHYASRCHEVAKETEARCQELQSTENFPPFEYWNSYTYDQQIYLQELLNLFPENQKFSFWIDPMFDDVEIAHQQIIEQIRSWKTKEPLEIQLAKSIQHRIQEIVMGYLMIEKKNKEQNYLEIEFLSSEFLLPKVIQGIKQLAQFQIQMLQLELEYKKLVLLFHFQTEYLLNALHLEYYATLLEHPVLSQAYRQMSLPLTKEPLEKIILELESILGEKGPSKQVAYTLLSRAHYYLGTFFYTTKNRQERLAIYKKGKEYGVLGVRENPQMASALDKGQSWDRVLKFSRFQDTPSLYWMCGNWSRYGDTLGMSAATDAPTIRDIAFHVSQKNPFLDGSGCFRFLGVYYCRVPKMMGQDPQKARLFFQKAIEQSPEFFGNRLLMAEYYCPLTEDEELYEKLCKKILESPFAHFHPEWTFENAYSYKQAEYFLSDEGREEFF